MSKISLIARLLKTTALLVMTAIAVPDLTKAAPTSANHNSTQLVRGQFFDRVVIVMLENKNYGDVSADPYFKSLAARGRLLTNYKSITHPSQPNYVGQLFGSTSGVILDFNSNIGGRHLVDLLEEHEISWKGYMEDYPGNCFTDDKSSNKLYVRKHNPFISANTIRENPARCANIVNANDFDADIAAGRVPQFVYYTPNMNNDGHNTNLLFASNWLQGFLEPRLSKLVPDTLIVVLFDENENWFLRNQVWVGLLGSAVEAGETDGTGYNHYSLLRTIEDNWSLGTLGREDARAQPFLNLGK